MVINRDFSSGIIFAFCYTILCSVVKDIIFSILLFFKVSAIILPFIFTLLLVGALIYILKKKQANPVSVIFLMVLIIIRISINAIGLPAKLYLGNYSVYTYNEQIILKTSNMLYNALCTLLLLCNAIYFSKKE